VCCKFGSEPPVHVRRVDSLQFDLPALEVPDTQMGKE